MCWYAVIVPASKETSSGSAPASSSACQGRSSSACSTPSVARTATFIPSSSPAMGAPLPGPPTGHTRAHYGFSVLDTQVAARAIGRALAGRCVAGPGAGDAVRVAADVVSTGAAVALEHAPAPGQEAAAFGELIDRVQAAGLASACELALPVGPLGTADARALATTAAGAGLSVALVGPWDAVRELADALPEARVVVLAGAPDGEDVCRARAGGRVRLTAGRGAAADRAFVRCLNVLMAGSGRPAVAAWDPRLVAITGERAVWNDRPPDSWEYVMPLGIRTELRRRLVAGGAAVRVAVPSGPAAAAALARRLAGRA
jgi:proline dehydrogenase